MVSWKSYASANVPIVSLVALAYGFLLTFAPSSSFVSQAYTTNFIFMPSTTWGLCFMTSAVMALSVRAWWGVAPLLTTMMVWTLMLLWTVLFVETSGAAPTAPLWVGGCTACLAVSIVRRGFINHDQERRRKRDDEPKSP